jgi:hypothetical protein
MSAFAGPDRRLWTLSGHANVLCRRQLVTHKRKSISVASIGMPSVEVAIENFRRYRYAG